MNGSAHVFSARARRVLVDEKKATPSQTAAASHVPEIEVPKMPKELAGFRNGAGCRDLGLEPSDLTVDP